MDKNRGGFISKMENGDDLVLAPSHQQPSGRSLPPQRRRRGREAVQGKAFQLLEYQWREGRYDQLPAHASPLLFMTGATSMVQGGRVEKQDLQEFKRSGNVEVLFNGVGEISAR